MIMASLQILCCVIVLLFNIASGNVPVLLWESSKSDRVNTFTAFHRITSEDFQQYVLKKVHGEQPVPLIVVFAEERLSIEDFSWQDSVGNGYFPQLKYITENAANREFLPSVQDPIKALNQLSQFGYSFKTIEPNAIANLPDFCGKVLIIKLQEAKPEEDRADLLRRHDGEIDEAYSQLLSKCSHVIGIMSGNQPSWMEPEEVTRLRRSTDENSTTVTNNGSYTLYTDSQANSMLYSSKDPKLSINGKETSLPNSPVVSGDISKGDIIKLSVKYGSEHRLTFNFDNKTSGYWYLRNVEYANMMENVNIYLKSTNDIYAPLSMSYHCGTPVVFRNVSGGNVTALIFSDLQVEPFFFKQGSKSFSEAVDEVPFFTPAIWSGIFVTLLLALIFTWGLTMIMDIRTMDQFDDPKGKTITVSATD